MTGVFGPLYANQYDALYGEKNYPAECDAVETLARRYGSRPAHDFLDLGCGTGTHAFLLASRGRRVVGVDRSPAMLALAWEKAKRPAGPGPPPDFIEGDVRTIRVGRSFDTVLMLFAVMGYQTSDADVADALRTAAVHLRPGGTFICDLWFGPAVLATGTSDRMKVIDGPDGQLHRASSGTLDAANHSCRVHFRTWRSVNGRVVDESTEDHTMRYFFEPELRTFFGGAGLELRAIHPFGDLGRVADAASWNVWVCGRAAASA